MLFEACSWICSLFRCDRNDIQLSGRRVSGIFVLYEQESYQKMVAIILFLTFWNGYIFTVFHKKKDAIFINLVGFVLIIFLILKFINLEFFIKWLIILILGTLYNSNIFNINIREFWLVKTFYVGLVWAMSLVWLPLENFHLAWFFIIFLFTFTQKSL
jgi:hypothetical protein